MNIKAQHYRIIGQVQGVGFRPYIYRLAHTYHLKGWVKNLVGVVEIHVQGDEKALQQFADNLIPHAPPLAQPHIEHCQFCPLETVTSFEILTSETTAQPQIHVPADYSTCDACLQELNDPTNSRYQYPFINCTQCGPRYTIITRLPYDRPNTSMVDFPLCPNCKKEYLNPADRRFHAQPIACPVCGPQLHFHYQDLHIHDTQLALTKTIKFLKKGLIIAIKGIGGYHLMCDAQNDEAILRLRHTKPRPDKPLAVLFPLNNKLLQQVKLSPEEKSLLYSPIRPIVLLEKNDTYNLSPHISPKLKEIGVMLPYSPLHHLLLSQFSAPLIATSANISGEPVLTNNDMVEKRLSHVAEAFLHHNRPIVRPADDAIFKVMLNKPRPIRLGRGIAPLELKLPFSIKQPVLAVGSYLKNTIALAWQQRIIISPHIGDLHSPRSLEIFQQVITDLQNLYEVKAEKIICDAHPNYANTRWAKNQSLPVQPTFHHYAHASALAGEFFNDKPWLMFTWDGVGLGEDGTLWGGETLYGNVGKWERVAHLCPFKLIGGDKAVYEPYRIALSLELETSKTNKKWIFNDNLNFLKQMWQKDINCPTTTAVGRLFDGVAALLGIAKKVSFEGQAAMELEALCLKNFDDYIILPIEKNKNDIYEINWQPLIKILNDTKYSINERITLFHNSLAHNIVDQVILISKNREIHQIGLCGGVFQNKYLIKKAHLLLKNKNFTVKLSSQLPCNDAAISYGQVIESEKTSI